MDKKKVLRFLLLSLILVFLGLAFTITLALANQEVRSEDVRFSLELFRGILISGILMMTFSFFIKEIWLKDNKYGGSLGFISIGEKPALPFFKKLKPLQLTLISAIVFFGLFFLVNFARASGLVETSAFTSTITLQQFSQGASLLFSNIQVPISEEAFNIGFMSVLIIVMTLLAVKKNWSNSTYQVFYFGLIPLIMSVIAVLWHLSAYPNSQIAWYVVGMFWFIKSILILLTGFIVVGIFMHMANNLFIDLADKFPTNLVWTYSIIVLASLIALYFLLYARKKKEPEVLT